MVMAGAFGLPSAVMLSSVISIVNENRVFAFTDHFGFFRAFLSARLLEDAAGVKVKRICYQTTQTQALPMMVFAALHEVVCGL
jgi:hypothetical protein